MKRAPLRNQFPLLYVLVLSEAFTYGGTVSSASPETIDPSGELPGINLVSSIHAEVYSVAFSHNGSVLALADPKYKGIGLWNVEADTSTVLAGHSKGVTSVSFSPVAMLLASASEDGTVKLWDVETHTNIATLESQSSEVTAVLFSPDGATLAAGASDGVVTVWNVYPRPSLTITLGGSTDWIWSLSFSDDGTLLASGAWDGVVGINDMVEHDNVATIGGHSQTILDGWFGRGGFFTPVSFSPRGRLLAFGRATDGLELWDVEKRKTITTLGKREDAIISAEFSPDGRFLASRTANGVEMWDVATKEVRLSEADEENVTPAVFSPDGSILALTRYESSTYGNHIVLWDAETGERVASQLGHHDGVYNVTFSPDGTRLASNSFDGTVKLWDTSPFIVPETPLPDFDDDGTVGFDDFVQFAGHFGLSEGDEGYDARFDLDGNGAIGFSDFLVFAAAFGKDG